jgi:hypothetical protein
LGLAGEYKKDKIISFQQYRQIKCYKVYFESVRNYSYLELPLLFLEILQMLKPIYAKKD